MDKRKLIGTIIGVTMFGLLIVGATYAWLTFTANITNGTYNTGSRNFVINYNKGTNITTMPILSIESASEVTSAASSTTPPSSLQVSAALNSATTPKGRLKLTLHTTADGTGNANLISGGAIKYSVKIGNGTPTAPQTITSTEQLLVLTGTNTTTYDITSTTATTFTVYFWLDAAATTNAMIGTEYSGYIDASATQLET